MSITIILPHVFPVVSFENVPLKKINLNPRLLPVKVMSILINPLKKIGSGLAGMAAMLPDASTLRKGTKAAAVVSTVALLGKLAHTAYKKAGKKTDDVIAEKKCDAVEEVKTTINKSLEKFIFECLFRWLIYLSLIVLAYAIGGIFNLRKDILVAFVVLGIDVFCLIKLINMLCWYCSFCRENGFMYHPREIIRAYLKKAILDRVQRTKEGLFLPVRLVLNFFGPNNDKLAGDITELSMKSTDLKREAWTRIGMWLGGFIIYCLVYRNLFLFVTGIDFNAVWEPFIWPFYVLIKILSV